MRRSEKELNKMMRTTFLQYKKEKPHGGLQTCFIIAALLFIIYLTTARAHAGPDWQVDLTVQSGTAYNHLAVGADITATDGYDPVWDTYALMGGTIEAFFSHPEWGLPHQEFHRDIRAHNPGAAIELALTVNSTLANANFTISWDISALPQDNPVILIDDTTSQQIDMRTTGSYNFTYTSARSFRIHVTEYSACSNLPVRIARSTPLYFSSLQSAYNAAADGDIIESRALSLSGNLAINLNKSVSFAGGFNCSYTSSNSSTTMQGTLTISNGSVSIENIAIE